MDRLMNSPCVARDTYAGRGPAPRIVRASAAYPHGSGTLLAWESVARGQAVSDTFLFRTGDDYFVHCVYFDGYADEFIVPVDQQTARRLFAFFRAKLTNDDAAFAPSAVARLASGVA
jgi:hypothetical protein